MIFLVSEREGPLWEDKERAAGLSPHSRALEDMCLQAYNPEKENSQQVQVLTTDYEYKEYILSLFMCSTDWIQEHRILRPPTSKTNWLSPQQGIICIEPQQNSMCYFNYYLSAGSQTSKLSHQDQIGNHFPFHPCCLTKTHKSFK